MMGKLRNMSTVYLTCNDKILLLYRKGSIVIADSWTGSAGGHFEEQELNDARACVLRELNEELAVDEKMIEKLKLKYITLRRTNGEIRQNYYFFAELKNGENLQLKSNEGEVKWFPLNDELNNLKMPFTAQHVVKHYLSTGKYTEDTYGGIANEKDVIFSVLYEF
ncbi:MAG: NUDIX domain-containing protein [Clostridia bacterium]|nr:NUDIX domain-containing protein [Clostridia bacterium]